MLKKKTHPCHFNELSGIGNSSLKFSLGCYRFDQKDASTSKLDYWCCFLYDSTHLHQQIKVLKVVSKLCSTC